MKMIADNLSDDVPLKDFRFMSHKALMGVTSESLQPFAEKCGSLESLIISGTKNCVEEARTVLTDFVVKII